MSGLARASAVRSSIRRPAGSCSVHSPAMSSKLLSLSQGVLRSGAAVAARHQGQILGDEVADAQVLFGLVDAGGVDHAARLPERP